jgi:NAD(P)-dependent dehydrogenase (short-subunit alcohol dehydrogenase family)
MPSEVNSKPVWLIVGGSRGIGLEFVKQVTH